jgi:hypothetical protein
MNYMELENLHQWVLSNKPEGVDGDADPTDSEFYGPLAVQYIADSLGEKGKVQCITAKQAERLSRLMEATMENAPENKDVETAVQLLTLSFKADCTRCTNPTCDFRRAANPTLANVVRPPVVGVPLNSEGFYDPIVQD